MDLSGLLDMLSGVAPWLEMSLTYAGGLYVTSLAFVALTPTQKDDGVVAWVEKHPLLGALSKFLQASSPVQRKPKK